MTLDVPSILDERELRISPLGRARAPQRRGRLAPVRASDRSATREPMLAAAAAPAVEAA